MVANRLRNTRNTIGTGLAGTCFVVLLLSFVGEARAFTASDYRWGVSAGYGGTGISSTQPLSNGAIGTVQRSDGPVVASVFVETLLSDYFGLAFEHSRGVNFVPFSAGVSFTGFVSRWYFLEPAPAMSAAPSGSTILIKRFVPFYGIAVGLAQADIQRDVNDGAPTVSGSGMFFGMRLGADYPTKLGQGIRPELVVSTTQYSSMFATAKTAYPAPLIQEFSLQCAWYFNF